MDPRLAGLSRTPDEKDLSIGNVFINTEYYSGTKPIADTFLHELFHLENPGWAGDRQYPHAARFYAGLIALARALGMVPHESELIAYGEALKLDGGADDSGAVPLPPRKPDAGSIAAPSAPQTGGIFGGLFGGLFGNSSGGDGGTSGDSTAAPTTDPNSIYSGTGGLY